MRAEQKRAALVSMLRAWRSYGDRAFKVSPYSEHWKPLSDAEQLGWVTWIGDRCRLERLGIEQLIPFGVKVDAELQTIAEVVR
jgi:hypothetical protein